MELGVMVLQKGHWRRYRYVVNEGDVLMLKDHLGKDFVSLSVRGSASRFEVETDATSLLRQVRPKRRRHLKRASRRRSRR